MRMNITIWKDRLDWETDEVIEQEAEVDVVVEVSDQELQPNGRYLNIVGAHWVGDGEEVDLDLNEKWGVEARALATINEGGAK